MKRLLINVILAAAPLPLAHAALIFDNEGARLYAQGEYARASEVLCKAVAEEQGDPAALASTLFNLAAAERVQAHLGKAAELYKQSIDVREGAFGPDVPELARPLAGLALVYQGQGRVADALPLARRAARLNPGDADVRNTLATLLLAHGDIQEGASTAAAVVRDLEGTGRMESQEYVAALANLGTAKLRLGDASGAETELRKAGKAALNVTGGKKRLIATIWNNLAKARAAQGDYKSAEQLFTKAIGAWRETLGSQHPDVAYGLSNLANLYQRQGRYSEAERLYRQAMEIDTAVLGGDSLKVATDLGNLGALFAIEHRLAKAEPLLEEALAKAEKSAGVSHPDTAGIAVNLAVVYNAEGKHALAATLLARAVPVKEQSLPKGSTELAALMRLQASEVRATRLEVQR